MCTRTSVVAAVAILLSTAEAGVGADAAALETKVVSVALFKNGLAFVTREGVLPEGEVSVSVEGLPAAAHGTFWVHSPDAGVVVRDLVASEHERVRNVEAVSVAELLEANVGRTVSLRLGGDETIRAKVLSVAADRWPAPVPTASAWSALGTRMPPAEPASLVLLETGGGILALDRRSIQRIGSLDGPLSTSVERRTRAAALRLRARSPERAGRLVVQYLAKGITWAPSCVVDISAPDVARLSAKAEVIDEIEDLDGAAVSFVTGFPNLQFADVADPMAMRGDLASFLDSLRSPRAGPAGGRGVLTQQVVLANVAQAGGETAPGYLAGTPLEGQAGEELFFYERAGVGLRRGERGYYPLYTLDVPYEHVYEWKIGDVLDEQERYRGEGPDEAGEVWHGVRPTNTGRVPWTTSPAMTVQDGRVLGQDLVYYTSVGATTVVRITRAVDIRAEQAEHEVERKRGAASFYGHSYDLVEVHGRLAVGNFKTGPVTITIAKQLSGEVVRSTPEARVEQTAKGLRKVNPVNLLRWELPVEGRGRIEIEYDYRVYVRG